MPVYKAIGEFQTGNYTRYSVLLFTFILSPFLIYNHILCDSLAKKSNGKKKDAGDDLFDMLDTSKLNAHLKELMPGLTAKVFRTFNASVTLDNMVSKMQAFCSIFYIFVHLYGCIASFSLFCDF